MEMPENPRETAKRRGRFRKWRFAAFAPNPSDLWI